MKKKIYIIRNKENSQGIILTKWKSYENPFDNSFSRYVALVSNVNMYNRAFLIKNYCSTITRIIEIHYKANHSNFKW